MNPVVMCNTFIPCTDEQWFVFGIVALVSIAAVLVIGIADNLYDRFKRRQK